MKNYSLLMMLFFIFGSNIHAQQQPADTLTIVKDSPIINAFKEPFIISVSPQGINPEEQDYNNNIPVVYPWSLIKVRIANPLTLLQSRPADKSQLILYANGVALKGMATDWFSDYSNQDIINRKIALLKDTTDIFFILKRDQATKIAWNFFYSNTKHWYQNDITLNLSVGWEGMSPIIKKGNSKTRLTVKYFQFEVFLVWIVGFVLFIAASLYLAIKTDLLRECDVEGAYSLSLTQLMFWTVLIIGAFIYTLVLTDIASTLNTSVLLLLGISLSTTGFASLIDNNKKNRNEVECKTHINFFKDILTDGNCYSVQRAQIVAWNLVLGVYFILYTINNKDMPEFSETLLFLAGISSASYLTGKIPENKIKNEAIGSGPVNEDKAVG